MRLDTARAVGGLLLWISVGCGGGGGPPDGGGGDAPADGPTDAPSDGSTDPCERTFSFEEVTADGHDEPLGAGAEQARAGRLEEAELPPDPTGLGFVETGDFALANDRIAVIIEAMDQSDMFDPWGGKPVGIATVRDGSLVEPADYNELMFLVSRFIVKTTSVGVVNDGSDGEAAVIRTVGTLETIPFLREFPGIETLASTDLQDMAVAMEYTLEPGAEHVDIAMRIGYTNERGALAKAFILAAQRARMPAYAPGQGFEPRIGQEVPYMAYVRDGATSYAVESPRGPTDFFLEISDYMVLEGPRADIEACAEHELAHTRLHVGGPGIDGLREAVARAEGRSTRQLDVTVENADGSAAEGVRVHAEGADGERYLTRATTDAAGELALHVPADEAVQLTAWRRGDEVAGPRMVAADGTSAGLTLAEVGFVRVTSETLGGDPLPARIQITPDGSLPSVDARFGEAPAASGRLHTVFPADGVATLRVPVGRHRVVVSHGFEHTIVDQEVDVASGETVDVLAQLERVVDTTDVMCGDFHIHTTRSPDATDSGELKVRTAVADGVEVPVRSDHEWINDFEPVIADLGLGQWAFGIGSLELTTFSWGHMGVFPLEPDPSQPNDGAIDWVGRKPPEVFDDARSRATDPAIIINHPRTFGVPIAEYFAAVGLDAATGMVEEPDMWDEEFKLVEVFNSSSFDENEPDSVQDWFALLGTGRRVFAVGSSDSHDVLPGSPVGYPRTCMHVGTDDPETLRTMGASHVRDVTLAGDMVVSGGIYVEAATETGGVRPGGELTGASETELVDVRVQAPCWVDVDTLEVWVDGSMRESIDIAPAGACETVRFDDQVMVPVASGGAGSWVIVHAKGDSPLDPVHDGRMPFGVTNPIFLRR